MCVCVWPWPPPLGADPVGSGGGGGGAPEGAGRAGAEGPGTGVPHPAGAGAGVGCGGSAGLYKRAPGGALCAACCKSRAHVPARPSPPRPAAPARSPSAGPSSRQDHTGPMAFPLVRAAAAVRRPPSARRGGAGPRSRQPQLTVRAQPRPARGGLPPWSRCAGSPAGCGSRARGAWGLLALRSEWRRRGGGQGVAS